MSQDTNEADHAVTGHPNRRIILAVLCLSLIAVVVAVSSLNVAIPHIFLALEPNATEQLWILESYALVFAFLLLPAGALGDRFGRKTALLGGLAIFGGGAILASMSTSAVQVIAFRAVMGVGAAFVMPATLSIITNVFPPHERQKAIATWAGLAGAGGAIGPLLSGLVLRWWDWPSVFLVNLPLVVLLCTLAIRFVPQSKDPKGHPLDPLGVVLSILAIGALVFGIIEGPESGWASGLVLGSFAVAVVSIVGFVTWELRAPHPMLDPRLFKLPGFSMGSLSITVQFFGMFGMYFLLSQYLQFVKGYTPLTAGLGTLPAAVTIVTVTQFNTGMVQRFGVRKMLRGGFAVIAVGFVVLSFIGPTTPYILVAIGLMIVAAGMACTMPPASSLIVTSLPLSKAGVGSAVNDVTREVGGAIGIAVMGTVVSSVYHSAMTDKTSGLTIPDAIREQIEDSVAKAFGIAARLPEQLGAAGTEAAHALREAASASYTDGTSWAFRGAAIVVLLVSSVVARFVPNEIDASNRPEDY